jgi:hypothetical protein
MQAATVWLLLILGVALGSPYEIYGQTQSTPLIASFEGCYDLTMGRWWPWPFGEENRFVTPPGQIRLIAERGKDGWEKDGFLISALPPRKSAASGRRRSAYWNVKPPNEIDLIWNDGFTGVRLSLKRSEDGLRGWAHPYFDYTKLIPRIAHVIARKIDCHGLE